MSFLAKLRDQHTAREQGTRLGYVLIIEAGTRRARLRLSLSDPGQGPGGHPVNPYAIQRQHLERPPYFLLPEDVGFIDQLVNADKSWIGQCEGYLPSKLVGALLKVVEAGKCYVGLRDHQYTFVSLSPACQLDLAWKTGLDGAQHLAWQAPAEHQLMFLSPSPLSSPLVFDRRGAQICESYHALTADALNMARRAPPILNVNGVGEFMERNAMAWRNAGLPLPAVMPVISTSAEVVPVLIFASGGQWATTDVVQLHFYYETNDFCVLAEEEDLPVVWNGRGLYRVGRKPDEEKRYRETIKNLLENMEFVPVKNQSWAAEREDIWIRLLVNERDKLEGLGYRFVIGKHFSCPFVPVQNWKVTLTSRGEDGYQFSANLNIHGQTISLLDLLARLRDANREAEQLKVALQNGLILLLPKKVSELLEEIADLVVPDSGEIRLHKNQLARLKSISDWLPESTVWNDNANLLDQARQLCASPLIAQDRIPGLRAELRPYQWLGVCWLQHLTARGVNGLLADDMGLGKTLQTIAHLCLEREQGRLQNPALIVVPTSLLHNWRQELERFAPQLNCLVLHGADRNQHWPQLQSYHVLISSYHLAVRDLEIWRRQKLSWLILDEAQAIKNRQTQVRQAVKEISAARRLCLSGTPVENHLGELWSIFDFLLPGCLGDYSHFRQHYRKPIEEQADARRLQKLLGIIAPFMLRRTKNQIARELPPKTVIHQNIDMDDEQREFYQALKKQSADELELQLTEANGAGTRQIILLAALTRLRQACCDPALVGAEHIISAKRRHCVDMICELVDEGRSLLLFSQFTRMLDLIAQDLQQEKINFLLLTGETQNRQQKVDAFQNGAAPVFLISLKAGGVGLNLTRADTVIHFDPWWNSAAEEQASDRAHRIGQDKPVFVYKLIMRDTIEEKIVAMQERKFALGANVNQQAELSGRQFSLKLEDLLLLWQSETQADYSR